jgi:uncharacterized damage-inducible protein DinB
MAIKDAFIGELKHESTLTKKILERVPVEKKDWKPHEKSMTLGRLATHVAEISHWVSRVVTMEEFDFLVQGFSSHTAASQEELMTIFNEKLNKAIEDLQTMNDESFNQIWTVRRGEQVLFAIPKKIAIRSWALNHMIHHRGQLSVYLRLLDVPVPGMYGPSADEKM